LFFPKDFLQRHTQHQLVLTAFVNNDVNGVMWGQVGNQLIWGEKWLQLVVLAKKYFFESFQNILERRPVDPLVAGLFGASEENITEYSVPGDPKSFLGWS